MKLSAPPLEVLKPSSPRKSLFCHSHYRSCAADIAGGALRWLPGRSARDVTSHLQHMVELSCIEDAPLSGFVLDIIKCYNALPRPPMQNLLTHSGCPEFLATGLTFSTTGLPEGDGVSVAASVALGWMFTTLVSEFGLSPQVYVDNWAWTAEQDELHTAEMAQTLVLTQALKIQIDWRKTFA